jgi:hypothetical protein
VEVCRTEAIAMVPNAAHGRPSPDYPKLIKKLMPALGWAMFRAKVARMRGTSATDQNAG